MLATYIVESFGVCWIFRRGGVVIIFLFFGDGLEVHMKHTHEPMEIRLQKHDPLSVLCKQLMTKSYNSTESKQSGVRKNK